MAPRSWRLAFWLGVAVSFVSVAATIVFLTIVTIALFTSREPARAVAIIAIGLQAISLTTISAPGWREASQMASDVDLERSSRTARRHRDVLISSVFASLASVATLATIVWTGLELSDLPTIINLQPSALLAGLIATFAVSVLSSTLLFATLLISRRNPSITALPPTTTPTTIVMTSRPETSKSATSNPFSNASDTVSSPRTPTSISFSSIRSSFTLPSRNSSAKSKRLSSRPASKSETSPFDSWDTSSVTPSLRDTIHTHVRAIAPSRIPSRTSTKLPPIPGSRPASPAKPLDGPFLPPSPHPSQTTAPSPRSISAPQIPTPHSPTPPSPLPSPTLTRNSSTPSLPHPNPPFATRSYSVSNPPSPSPGGSTSSLPLNPATNQPHVLPRTYSTTSLADSVSHLTFRGAPGLDEENIHPLFRSSSPTPPPGTTHGTIVTAASISEALGVGANEGLRSRAPSIDGSKAGESPRVIDGPRMRDRALSQPGSLEGMRSRAPSAAGSPLAREAMWSEWPGMRNSGATKSTGGGSGSIREVDEGSEDGGEKEKEVGDEKRDG